MIRPKTVSKGDPVTADDHNELVAAILERTPQAGRGTLLATSPGGFRYSANVGAGGGGGSSSGTHPFKVHSLLKTVGEDVVQFFGVEPASELTIGISWDKQTITGLLTDSSDPNDAGWQEATEKFCYLAGTTDASGSITACEIEWNGKLPGETGTGTEFERIRYNTTATPYQDRFHVPIAYLTKTTVEGVDTWTVTQYADRHLTLLDFNINGIVCRYPLACM